MFKKDSTSWTMLPPGKDMYYRDPAAIDGQLGKKRKAAQIGTSFWQWPLWQRYKTHEMLLYPNAVGTST